MLFTIIVLAVVAALIVYASKKKKTPNVPTTTFVETLAVPSIHEEIAKTVKETKNLAPIANEVSKTKAKKTAKSDKGN